MGKASRLCFDVEAYRTRDKGIIARVTDEAITKRPAQNTAKRLKDVWDTQEEQRRRAQDALDKTAVNPLLAEILCVVCRADGGEMQVFDAMERTRAQCMAQLAEYFEDVVGPETTWTGFNITRYDLPLLLTEFRRAGVRPGEWFPQYRTRWCGRVYDSMARCPTMTPFISLDAALEAHGLHYEPMLWLGDEMCGSRVGAAFEAGEYDLIHRYCQLDITKEDDLYRAMTFGGIWGTWASDDDLHQQMQEIDQGEGLTAGQRSMAKLALLEARGLI